MLLTPMVSNYDRAFKKPWRVTHRNPEEVRTSYYCRHDLQSIYKSSCSLVRKQSILWKSA